ncbi:DUF2244 domain-containing protein [Cohaesibacter celericrescens]|uniref:DUF2244 domain-containing protein n=2 Tax=Cohaesibacter celericrescens TaxID=2067669 RepID=A0A2N5XNW5_9HYPH|nr:DUF2244 domain-containing protein [Cohaesibacter celericrescens]
MTMIDENSAALPTASGPYFNAILHPYRSMGRKGFFWIIVCIGGAMLVMSIPFFLLGAWPIIGFAGLDVLLLYWALRRNCSDARAKEQIEITHDKVTLVQTSPKGHQQQFCFNPYWVRLEAVHEEDKGMTKLSLTSHGQSTEIGAFLHACERESLAQALKTALQDAKTTKTMHAQVSGG